MGGLSLLNYNLNSIAVLVFELYDYAGATPTSEYIDINNQFF